MTHEDLENYINGFPEIVRESVLKEILDSDILVKAFETKEGKTILSSAAELINSNVMGIVAICNNTDKAEERDLVLKDLGNEINITYKLMVDWAKILIKGTDHRNKIG